MSRSVSADAFLVASGAAPAIWAIDRIALAPDAAHALSMVRASGPGWTGMWRALDVLWSAPFLALPLGTRALRAGLASAFALAAFGIALFVVGRRLLRLLDEGAHPLLSAALACVGSLVATLTTCAQLEGSAPAGSTLGAALAVLPLAFVYPTNISAGAFAMGLCAGYELDVFVCALPVALRVGRPPARAVLWFLAGLLSAALALFRNVMPPSLALDVRALASPLGEGSAPSVDLRALLSSELGLLVAALALAGLIACVLCRKSRMLGIAIALSAIGGIALAWAGAPAGPTRYAPCVLSSFGALGILSAAGMQKIATRIGRVPAAYARASAIMVILLAFALPFKAVDDTSWRLREQSRATSAWIADVTLSLPPHALVIMPLSQVTALLVALRACGELGDDIVLLPPYDVRGRMATREVLRDPALGPLVRDVVLDGSPKEYALSSLATQRPVFVAFDPRYDRAIARHLVPLGALDRFMAEPRGASDRRRALDAFATARDRLARSTRGDAELRKTIAALLRARALAAGASGDRDAVGRTVEDLRRFAPNDATGGEIVKRIVLAPGPVDVSDLPP